jgi:hypothetical protein
VTALSMSQVWDHKLAVSKDMCHVSDRTTVVAVLNGTVATFNANFPISINLSNTTSVIPGNLGARMNSLGAAFLRYRINRLLACWRPVAGTTTSGRIALGFLDDAFPAAAETPGNAITVTDLRCSHSDSVYRDIEVEWRPIDSGKWYYVDVAAAGLSADQRLAVPCILAVAGDSLPTTATNYGGVTLYYDVTFEGATSVSATTP